jgi:F-box and WD-40 domain protein CDC4
LECVDDPTTLARASQVSKKWRELVNDDSAWRLLCQKFSFRALSKEERIQEDDPGDEMEDAEPKPWWKNDERAPRTDDVPAREHLEVGSPSSSAEGLRTQSLDRAAKRKSSQRKPQAITYRSHFKQRYMVETAWRNGGVCDARQITADQGVVTSLHLTKKYIVVALDNAKIHVFDTLGDHQKTLQGHVMGVWAMVPWGDLLVSGGCDRDVRVWNLATGYAFRLVNYNITANIDFQPPSVHTPRPHLDSPMSEDVRRAHSHLRLARYHTTHLGPEKGPLQACTHWSPG